MKTYPGVLFINNMVHYIIALKLFFFQGIHGPPAAENTCTHPVSLWKSVNKFQTLLASKKIMYGLLMIFGTEENN